MGRERGERGRTFSDFLHFTCGFAFVLDADGAALGGLVGRHGCDVCVISTFGCEIQYNEVSVEMRQTGESIG